MSTRESNPKWIDASRLDQACDKATTRALIATPIATPTATWNFDPEMAGKGGRKSGGEGGGPGQGAGTAVITRTKAQTQRPSMYRVLLLNDDYTPMDFVIGVLCTFFHKNFDDANRIMWQVHNNGVGECGVYTYEVADTKVTQVMDHARKHQHPLQCVMEKK